MATGLNVVTRVSAPEQAKQHRYGPGHWLLICDSSQSGTLTYSPDGDYWYSMDKYAERVFLYDADLYIDTDSTYSKVYEISVNSFAGVAGGVLTRKAQTYNTP